MIHESPHKWLVENINEFLIAMIEGEGLNKIEEMLDKLGEHKKVHIDFVDEPGDLKAVLLEQGPSPELAIVLQEKVALWLINHITVTDMDYRHFVENQK